MFDCILLVIVAGCFYFIGTIAGNDDTNNTIWQDCLNDKQFVVMNTTFECKPLSGVWGGHTVEFTK